MFEKTKLIMTLVFTLCFLAYSFLIGKFYEKFHMSRTAWIIVCVVLTAGLAVVFITDTFFVKHEKNQDNLEK
jgi:MFS-type transporter involved in bile tolerance (Atg22 family)